MTDSNPLSAEGPGAETTERLHKLLAAAGVASRRECEELITEGRVEVDGRVVTELGMRVDPRQQEIRLDGEKIKIGKRLYFAFYKPTGVLCTSEDPAGRSRVIDWIPTSTRIFTVGRLDQSSEGLILVTNDGELAQKLTHPKFGVEKTYDVIVAGHAQWESVKVLLDGVRLAEGWAKVKKLEIRKTMKDKTQLRIVLDEGKNREIRRLLARIGHKVLRLTRIAIGRLNIGVLQPGEHRELTQAEVRGLTNLASAEKTAERKPRRSAKAGEFRKSAGPGAGPGAGRAPRTRSSESRPVGPRASSGRPSSGRPSGERPASGRPERSTYGQKPRAAGTREAQDNGPERRPRKGRPEPQARPVRWGDRKTTGATRRPERVGDDESVPFLPQGAPRGGGRRPAGPGNFDRKPARPPRPGVGPDAGENPDDFMIIRRRKSPSPGGPPARGKRVPQFEPEMGDDSAASPPRRPAPRRAAGRSAGRPEGRSGDRPQGRDARRAGPDGNRPAGGRRERSPSAGRDAGERGPRAPREGSPSTMRQSSTGTSGNRRHKKLVGKVKIRRKRASD